jgi:hypothetical protein
LAVVQTTDTKKNDISKSLPMRSNIPLLVFGKQFGLTPTR